MTAQSLGRRASNSSATRGRPPVMSRVLALSVGRRGSTSPGRTSSPSPTERIAPPAVGQPAIGAVVAEHAHGRTQVRAAGRRTPVDDHAVGDAGGLVGFLAD